MSGSSFGYSSCLKWGYGGTIDVAAFNVQQAADVLGLDLTKVSGGCGCVLPPSLLTARNHTGILHHTQCLVGTLFIAFGPEILPNPPGYVAHERDSGFYYAQLLQFLLVGAAAASLFDVLNGWYPLPICDFPLTRRKPPNVTHPSPLQNHCV
jgi:hypothetical protein